MLLRKFREVDGTGFHSARRKAPLEAHDEVNLLQVFVPLLPELANVSL